MGYSTRVQLIKRRRSHQWYVNFPAALAEAMEFEKGELVEWVVESRKKLSLRRSSEREITTSHRVDNSLNPRIPGEEAQ